MILGLSDLENQLKIVVFSSVEVTMVTVILAYGNQEVLIKKKLRYIFKDVNASS